MEIMSAQHEEVDEDNLAKSARKRKLPEWMMTKNNDESEVSESGRACEHGLGDQLDLPILQFGGTIVYSYQQADCAALCQDIRERLDTTARTTIGFDMEWPVTFKSGQKEQKVALLQLCLDGTKCFLFQLSVIGSFPKQLEELLYDEKVLLVGVGIESDFWKLERDFDLNTMKLIRTQCVDLSQLAKKVLKSSERWSLENLCRNLFLRSISKDTNIRCSDWAQYPLTDVQKSYAATDAYVSLLIYQELAKREVNLQNIP